MANPDYLQIAAAYGIPAARAARREELAEAVARMLAADGPFLLEARVAEEGNVLPMTDFGLVQFTRKKVKKDNVAVLTKKCPYCRGAGRILSDSYLAFRIQIAIKKCLAAGYESVIVELNAGLAAYIAGERKFGRTVKREWGGKRIYLVPHKTFHEEYFTVKGDNAPVLTLPETAVLLY